MFIVCSKCQRVNVEGKWLAGTPPIGDVSFTVCPTCSGGEQLKTSSSKKRMAYTQDKWAKKK